MRTIYLSTAAVFLALLSLLPDSRADEAVTPCKAAELSLHRIERLVTLKKIDASFRDALQGVEFHTIDPPASDGSRYRSVVSLVPAADGSHKSIQITMLAAGNVTGFEVSPLGGTPSNPPVWPVQDSVTLAENALHYVLNESANKPELLPFYQSLTGFSLAPAKSQSGQPVAQVEIHAGARDGTLKVRVKLDGSFDSAEIVHPQGAD